MSLAKTAFVAASFVFLTICAGDVLVQLNVNRPFNDVSDKFVSFAIKPEHLYKALDGPNRKSMTRMASMLGTSYLKFIGDYYFASNEEAKLRNPTKVIWKGFNRWSRAVNWTMVIPVPYTPNAWDPMHTLKILNTSYLIGITDCIWQLGTDFGTSRAQDYVAELNTLNLMVDTFKPFVEDWQIMGADVSAGSSAEETRRYVEMSKDLNAAFGWTQPAEMVSPNGMTSYIYGNDPALKMLISKKVPVWLSLPQKSKIKRYSKHNNHRFIGDESTDALRWALTLGEAASSGFDAIFKEISVSDLEKPNFSFYVTALYKKVMGSRVFPARPLTIFGRSNKLYTHCANSVSGGIAFMVVNTEESPIQISVRSLTKFTGSEVWQYTLSYKKGVVLLNNERLTLNSTLRPQIRVKNPDQPVQLSAPGMSVSFWVLPTVNLEHCQFTEIEANEVKNKDAANSSDERNIVQKRYSSADKLLKKLIRESSLSHSPLALAINRRRRYATFANSDRSKRFILEAEKSENKQKHFNGFGKLLEPFNVFGADDKILKKREDGLSERRNAALEWIKQLMDSTLIKDEPLLQRRTRSADEDNYFGPLFATKDGKKTTAFTKKITEIKKPDKKIKPIFDFDEEFDEEEFFKKVGNHDEEPAYRRFPDGDVHLKHITNTEGDYIEDYRDEKKKLPKKVPKTAASSRETVSEMKPLRLLPTEFYEAMPLNPFRPAANKLNIGGALNSLLFAEPFSKKILAQSNQKLKSKHEVTEKNQDKEEDVDPLVDSMSEVDPFGVAQYHKGDQQTQDFLRAQRELIKAYLDENAEKKSEQQDEEDGDEEAAKVDEPEEFLEDDEKMLKELSEKKRKYIDYLTKNFDNYFGEDGIDENAMKDNQSKESKVKPPKKVLDEQRPWWHLSLPLQQKKKRTTRALHYQIPEGTWRDNMITKDDEADLIPLGSMMPQPWYEYQVQTADAERAVNTKTDTNPEGETKPHKLVASVKRKVSNLVDIVTRHVSEWYNTLTKHTIEVVELTTPRGNGIM